MNKNNFVSEVLDPSEYAAPLLADKMEILVPYLGMISTSIRPTD